MEEETYKRVYIPSKSVYVAALERVEKNRAKG